MMTKLDIQSAGHTFVSLTGRKINLLNPRPEDICMNDICVGMATTNRWACQVPLGTNPLSCATHSLYVMGYIADNYPDSAQQFPQLILSALLNDADKAYLGQQPAAFTHAVAAKTDAPYQIKTALKKAIFTHFGLTYPVPKDLQDVITKAENRITASEIRDFELPFITTYKPVVYRVESLSRERSYDLFLHELSSCLPENFATKRACSA